MSNIQDEIEVRPSPENDKQEDPQVLKKNIGPPKKKKVKRSLREKLIHQIFLLTRINYFKLHFLYILGIGFLGAIILVATEHKRSGLSFSDSLFMSFTCASETGLATVDITRWSVFAQVVLLIIMQLGSIVLLSAPILLVRRYHMRHAFRGEKTIVRKPSGGAAVLTGSTQLVVDDNIEYRALGKLVFLIPVYWFCVQFFGFIILGSYISYSENGKRVTEAHGVNGWYWGFFTACSSFNNAGLTLYSDNLVPFQKDRLVLLILSVLISCGNTLYPVYLRWLVWLTSKIAKDKKPYQNLLANPRSYFTHLFPAKQTWIIFVSWIGITLIQMIFFLGFEHDNKDVGISNNSDLFLASFFQSVAIRTAGFNIVTVHVLSHALLVLYLLMMYLSAYPFIVSLRETAVNSKYQIGELGTNRRKRTQAVVKDLLIRDIFLLYVGLLLISMIEDNRFDLENFTPFHILFEVVSAYGTVGLSMGYPNRVYSFSGILRTGSQLIIIVMMILGRHRGLPESIDDAVNTKEFAPLESLLKKDARDYSEEVDDDDTYTDDTYSYETSPKNGRDVEMQRQ